MLLHPLLLDYQTLKKMKKITFLCISFLLMGSTAVYSQSFFDKIDRLAGQVENATNKVDRAANSAGKAGKTGGKLVSMISKKDKNSGGEKVSAKENVTVITVQNSDLATLKQVNSALQSIKGVSSSQMKFNAAKSVIKVSHTGTTEDLFEKIQPRAKEVFADKNVQSLDEGEISLKLK